MVELVAARRGLSGGEIIRPRATHTPSRPSRSAGLDADFAQLPGGQGDLTAKEQPRRMGRRAGQPWHAVVVEDAPDIRNQRAQIGAEAGGENDGVEFGRPYR